MSIIDRWVVTRAIELLKQRREAGGTLPLLAVNLSGTSLNEQSFAEFVLTTRWASRKSSQRAVLRDHRNGRRHQPFQCCVLHARVETRPGALRKFALDDLRHRPVVFHVPENALPVDFLKTSDAANSSVRSRPMRWIAAWWKPSARFSGRAGSVFRPWRSGWRIEAVLSEARAHPEWTLRRAITWHYLAPIAQLSRRIRPRGCPPSAKEDMCVTHGERYLGDFEP